MSRCTSSIALRLLFFAEVCFWGGLFLFIFLFASRPSYDSWTSSWCGFRRAWPAEWRLSGGLRVHFHFIDLQGGAACPEVAPLTCAIEEGMGEVGGGLRPSFPRAILYIQIMTTAECWTVARMAVGMVGYTDVCGKLGGLDIVRVGEGEQEGRSIADVSPGPRPGGRSEASKEVSV